LAFLPNADAYCEATPTERVPFFGRAVSSIARYASCPPRARRPWPGARLRAGRHPRPLTRRSGADGRAWQSRAAWPGLHALTIPRPDQTCDVERAHGPSCPMRQVGEEPLKPALEIALPVRSPSGHAAPPAFHNAGGIDDGPVRSNPIAKVVLAWAGELVVLEH
jgi:hypothetical protein